MAGQVYAVASGKGGVGKTTTVVNLGVVLRQADHTVALVDADLGMANLGAVVGVDGELTLHDVLAGEASVEDALVEEAPGFAVLAGSDDLAAYPRADPRGLGDILGTLAEAYDFVLVDTGAGMSHEDVLPLGLADGVLLVTTPEPAAIGDTRKTAELAKLADGTVQGLVITMADSSTDAADIASQIGAGLLGVIPYDAVVRRSTATATPLEGVAPESPAAGAYRELVAALTGEPVGEPTQTSEPDEPAEAAVDPDQEDAPSVDAAADEPLAEDSVKSTDETQQGGEEEVENATPADGADTVEAADSDASVEEEEAEAAEATVDSGEADPTEATDVGEEDTPSADTEASASGDGEASADGDAESEPTEDDAAETDDDLDEDEDEDEDDLDEYLEEFEDVEPAPSGGLFGRIRRLFR